MVRVRNPQQTRNKLLSAAAQVIAGSGVTAFTLDEVAAHAAISKGGLLHHFPTKQALLESMVVEVARMFAQRHANELAVEPIGARGRWARAYTRASFTLDANEDELTDALKIAVTSYPSLADVFCEHFAWTSNPPDDGLTPGRMALIRMACDAAWLDDLNAYPMDAATRSALIDELMELSR